MKNITIRIRALAPGVYFVICDEQGMPTIRSRVYHAICDLENALKSLKTLSVSGAKVTEDQGGISLPIVSAASRHKITLFAERAGLDLPNMLRLIPDAQLIDERDPSRLRTKISGQLLDFD